MTKALNADKLSPVTTMLDGIGAKCSAVGEATALAAAPLPVMLFTGLTSPKGRNGAPSCGEIVAYPVSLWTFEWCEGDCHAWPNRKEEKGTISLS